MYSFVLSVIVVMIGKKRLIMVRIRNHFNERAEPKSQMSRKT